MEKERAIEVLREAGIDVAEVDSLKNGKAVPGLKLGDSNISPIIYFKTIESIETEEELLEFAKKAISSAPEINVNELLTKDYVLSHVRTCVRHETDDERIVKFPVWGDLEEYFRAFIDADEEGSMSVVVTKELAGAIEADAEELRSCARANTEKSISIMSIMQMFSEKFGICEEDLKEMKVDAVDDHMYVAASNGGYKGASVMLFDSVLSQFCEEHGVDKIAIIPSSTEEVLLLTDTSGTEEEMSAMIQEVNKTIVSADDILSDHVYYFER